jgi:uncharacterized RDD family membrane protein YckC
MASKNRSGKGGGKASRKAAHSTAAPTTVFEPGHRPEKVYPRVLAHPLLRLYAAVIDVGLLVTLFFVLSVSTRGLILGGEDTAIQDIILFFAYWVLPTGFWGQTAGKWVAGIIVIDGDGRVPGVAQAIPREMVGRVVSIAALLLGMAWILRNPQRQGWHDIIAGTYVVRKSDSTAPGPFKFLGRMELLRKRQKD